MNAELLKPDGSPDIGALCSMFNRCGPVVSGGLAWIDNTRFCRWPNQTTDGKKHDIKGDPAGGAIPYDGASDCRPFVVDDIINERVAMKCVAFWNARMQPGASGTEEGTYAIALLEHLIWRLLFFDLVREVELSAQYEEQYGWMMLAPRWQREIGIKRKTITLDEIKAAAAQVQQTQNQTGTGTQDLDPELLQLAQLPTLIEDESLEQNAAQFLMQWYDRYIANEVPEDMRERVPKVKLSTALKAVRSLRKDGSASVPLAYLCKNQPAVPALKPWDEVFIAPELTTENEVVFQVERVHEAQLRSRIITDGYSADWVEKAVKNKGAITIAPAEVRSTPLGIGGLTSGGSPAPLYGAQPLVDSTLIEIVHAVYRDADEDGVPTVYCTTFQKQVQDSYAKHGEVEGAGSDLPYAAGVREWWCRSITASRGIPERAHTTQNIVKGILDSIIDRANMTTVPPVNVYESPTGTKYRFGPAVQNYVRQGREPKFMDGPTGQGMSESVQVLEIINQLKDNSYGLMSGDVPAPRLQTSQAMAVQRFLMTWNKALQQVVALCRVHMPDEDFAEITGAQPGWLDAHRDQDDCLNCALVFDVRELDPDLMMKRIEAMNNIALPSDVLGTINRAEWTGDMVRAFMGALAAKRLVQAVPDASQALRDKANLEVLKMFAGNQPNFIDKADPTAASLLQMVQQIVMSNPTYLRALSDDALAMIAGQQAPMIAQQLGQRVPDERFSELLLKYMQNLKFIGVTEKQAAQSGRMGINPQMQTQ